MKDANQRRCIVIIHTLGDGLGVLAEVLVRRRFMVCFWHVPAEPLPPLEVDDVDLVIALGGSQSPSEGAHADWRETEINFVLSAIEAGKAVLAICLGAQLLAMGLGGHAAKLDAPQIGLFPLLDIRSDSVLAPYADNNARVYQWHGYGFICPPQARVLAGPQYSENFCQAFMLGPRVLAVQFHLELNHSIMFSWLSEESTTSASRNRVASEVEQYWQQAERTSTVVFDNWLLDNFGFF